VGTVPTLVIDWRMRVLSQLKKKNVLSLLYRAAERGAELVALIRRDRPGLVEKILRVHVGVAQVFVEHPMKIVAAAAGDIVDLRAAAAAVLRRVGALADLELHHRFRGNGDGILVDRQIVVIDAVEQEVIGLLASAVHRNGPALGLVLRSLDAVIGSRHQQRQLQGIAAVQRKLGDLLVVDNIADGR
jgi:hypothetical protein